LSVCCAFWTYFVFGSVRIDSREEVSTMKLQRRSVYSVVPIQTLTLQT
jgi:hypothetical protein